jgi:S1-C subfamily serine protease
MRKGDCIHCHQINEFRRHDAKTAGTFRREDLWVYPLPENLGLVLDTDQGNKVRSVAAGTPAQQAGLRAGDILQRVNGVPTASFADVQYGLHRAPPQGKMPLTWLRDGKPATAELPLAAGWRKTNWTWRPSMLDALPSLSVYGEDLTAAEKKALGLSEKRLAFRQDAKVGSGARKAGVRAGDVIIGIDGQALEMTMLEFLAHVRRNYLVKDRITLNVLRDGKRIDLPHQLE